MLIGLIAAALLLSGSAPIALVDEPLCTPPLGASSAWLATQDSGGRFELPGYAQWTEGFPNYGVALGYLDGFTGDGVLGVFVDHKVKLVVVVTDIQLPEEELREFVGTLEAGYPTGAPPVDVVKSCYPLERTRRVVEALVSGTWHSGLTASTSTGGTWSVVPWPALGGAVEVWVAVAPSRLEDELIALLGEDAELLRFVVGEELLAPRVTTTTAAAPTVITDAPAEVVETPSVDENEVDEPTSEPDQGNGNFPTLLAVVAVLAAGLAIVRRRRTG